MTAHESEAADRAGSAASGRRRIWLCADDYGLSPSVNAGIRELIVRGRINATSAMVVAPSLSRSETLSLNILNTGTPRVAIGLHVTLTTPFRPLSEGFAPLQDGRFLPLGTLLAQAMRGQLDPSALEAEVSAQLHAFVQAFGRAPDFIDGHQHVQLFPQVRDAVLKVAKAMAPDAWLRQCGRALPWVQRLGNHKALLLDLLSRGFRRRATELGLRTNSAFAGAYRFHGGADFARLFERFLDHLPEGSLIMCHPGFVDAELQRLDPLTTLREREYAYFTGDAFPALLAQRGFALAAPAASD